MWRFRRVKVRNIVVPVESMKEKEIGEPISSDS